jgi:hypothetical protein
MWGLALDAILSFNLVLANGSVTTVSETQNSDLFWAMRGAGSSFGIATSISVRTFPIPSSATIYSFNWQLSASQAVSALSAYQSFALTANLPADLGPAMVFRRGGALGNVSITLSGGFYRADPNNTQLLATLAPILSVMPPPSTQSFDTGTYLDSAGHLAGGSLNTTAQPDATDTFYVKSLMTPEKVPMTDEAIGAMMQVIVNEGFTTPVTGWFFDVDLYGGRNSAVNSVKSDDTAFVHRDSLFTFQFYASSPGKVPPYPEAGFQYLDNVVNALTGAMPPDWDYGAYTNYVDDRLIDWQKRYYGANYARLQSLKDLYDPRGTFTFPPLSKTETSRHARAVCSFFGVIK